MNGVHDMAGMHGFDDLEYEENEPVFHHEWEGRVYAINQSSTAPIPGGLRQTIERLSPATYLASSYYRRWLEARIKGTIETAVFTQAEFDERVAYYRNRPDELPPKRTDPERVQQLVKTIHAPVSHRRDLDVQPAFKIGDTVRARNIHPIGHTRLPRYVRGKVATVVKYYGVQEIADTAVQVEAEPLYAVRFEGTELWGDSAEPNCAIYIDMWESYLETV